jgi:S1-C subfamily serine protease
MVRTSVASLVLIWLLVGPARAGDPATAATSRPLALEPLVLEASRWTVALQVDREEDEPSPALPRLPAKSSVRLPQDVVDYYKRPPGPATGILLDGDGNVLTSAYNVAGKLKSIAVVLPGGEVRPARLVATAKADDLALVRTEAPAGVEVPPVRWAAADRLRVGRIAVVLGRSPDPTRPTATFGIISAIGRNGGRAFQTDAKLNYGNVGGPVIDLDGAFLGIACFVGHTYPFWGLNSGIGFGTRADTIRSVLPGLLRGETLPPPEFPLLGVLPSNRPPEGNVGARLGRVEPDSAAAKGGLQADDVILEFDGMKVQDFVEFRRLINERRPGDEVTLRIRRGDRELELKVRLGKRGG